MKRLVALSVSVLLSMCCIEAQQADQNTQQTPPPAPAPSSATSSSSSTSAPAPPSERRISGGVSLSVEGFTLVPGRTDTINTSSSLNTVFQTTGASERIGYSLTVQGRVTRHFYVDLSGVLRRIGYQLTTTVNTTVTNVLNGTTYPSTTSTSTHEDTRADLIDIPLMVRYYGLGKNGPRSPRWFLEIGGTGRVVTDIRTSVDTTDASGTLTCCTYTPATPAHRYSYGPTVGAGLQFTDEFGIHVTPEVRYTRWQRPVFNNLTTTTTVNELEAVISLTF